MNDKANNSYDGYNYQKFRELAKDPSISMYEKVGFPDSYRENTEELIFNDILTKVPNLIEKKNLNVLDIGPGCSQLQKYISSVCAKNGHKLFLADSPEMLELIPNENHIKKYAGFFPNDTFSAIKDDSKGMDVIICYSTFQCIFAEGNTWSFLDCILQLMRDGAQSLIGDIPSISKRKRFFASPTGIKFHQNFMKTYEEPEVVFNTLESGKIDDSVLFSMVMRCQCFGYDAYIVPQARGLPFSNRRDDIIIRKY